MKDDLVSRSALLTGWNGAMLAETAREIIMRQPAKDAAPVVHGRWVKVKPVHYQCSVCGINTGGFTSNYCPNCGAKMDKGVNNCE